MLGVQKKERSLRTSFFAEREGFEPPVPLSTSVFKTGAIDHSATSPKAFVSWNVVFPFLTMQKYIKKWTRARKMRKKLKIFSSLVILVLK